MERWVRAVARWPSEQAHVRLQGREGSLRDRTGVVPESRAAIGFPVRGALR